MISLNLSLRRVLHSRLRLFDERGCIAAAMPVPVAEVLSEATVGCAGRRVLFVTAPFTRLVDPVVSEVFPPEVYLALCGFVVETGREVLEVGSLFSRCS